MNDKQCMETFILDIDKIVSGESVKLSDYEHCDVEYQEMLLIARLLMQADYTQESQGGAARVRANIPSQGQLEDDDLDLVAGGVNPDADPGLNKKQ